ncbi:MAG: MFS transporter [Pseudomonadota bacterium]
MSSNGSAAATPKHSAGAFSPFGHKAFALLWTATLISNTGTWMHDVGAGWLMTMLNPSPAVVTLVQAATTLPVFLFALFAGALADRLDKRRMLITINIALTGVIGLLAVLVAQDLMTPTLLIVFTLLIGTGAAFMAPAWQAVVPQLIPRDKLKPAIALNSMGINISRAIGPALAGVLIASIGLSAPFAINALSHVIIILALLLWRPETQTTQASHGSIFADMATGLRHVRHNQPMLATVVRAFAFFLFASAYWSLLPLIAKEAEGGGSELYGVLMALIGAGAVSGALLLPRLTRTLSADVTVYIGTVGTAIALLAMALSPSAITLMGAAFLGGLSWIAVLTSFNVSAQTALPNWVRARGLAVFLMVFFGSMAVGSVFWGQLASATSIETTLLTAALGLLLGLLVTRRFHLGQAEDTDLSPVSVWPQAPLLSESQKPSQPAMVTVEYAIDEADQHVFIKRLRDFAQERYRDGATSWSLHQSVENPKLWLETFHLPSWDEHLEQHKRITQVDADRQAQVKQLDIRDTGPNVRHYLLETT